MSGGYISGTFVEDFEFRARRFLLAFHDSYFFQAIAPPFFPPCSCFITCALFAKLFPLDNSWISSEI